MEYYDYDYEYFAEPSESDIMIENLKDTLKNEIKEEIKTKIERLEKENKELQEFKENKEKLEKEAKENKEKLEKETQNKIYELEREYQKKERELYKRPIQELAEIVQKKYYFIKREYLKNKKCDKCNNERKLELIDPYGKKHYVDCPCKGGHYGKYKVSTAKIGLIPQISLRNDKLCMYVDFKYANGLYDGEKYISGTFFNKDSIIYDYDSFIKKFEEKQKNKKEYSNFYDDYMFEKKEDAEKFAEYMNKRIEEGEEE